MYKEAGKLHEIPSLCMRCHDTGMTKLLMTKIPYFKELLVSSFECPHCHYKECDVRGAAGIALTAVKYELAVDVLTMDEAEVSWQK